MQHFHGLFTIDMGVLPNCSFIREKVDSRQFVSTITVSVTALPLAVWTVYTDCPFWMFLAFCSTSLSSFSVWIKLERI